jgi:formylglycine-generating enzyme required for sulfatase activity
LALLAAQDGRAADAFAVHRRLKHITPSGVAAALDDMARRWPDRVEAAPAWLGTLAADRDILLARFDAGETAASADAAALVDRVRTALLALPLLDADRLLAVRRGAGNLALPGNWDNLQGLDRKGLDNQIAILSGLRQRPVLEPVWQPPVAQAYAGDLCLHWDARRLLFTSNNAMGRYRVHQLDLASPGAPACETAQIPDDDVDNYAGCWLADDEVLFISTASMIGVPCVRGASHIGHLYRTEGNGAIRRLTFDQEHNWCPAVLADGRVMYLRWEYSDIPHFASRILFTMNPDGTGQRELYGSNSYWPNALFYARPIPDHPHRFAAIVSGHHGTRRAGELVVFDPSRGRFEADGVVQRIPGHGQPVVPVIEDRLVDKSWPRFLHPRPLGGGYILVSCQPDARSPWGLYLADFFDNLTLIHEEPGQALLEPILLEPGPRPPVIPGRVQPGAPARVKIVDIYEGPGLTGVPRGTVKALRVFTYAFSYRGMGGQVDRVGLDGPWDVRRVIGTVPVAVDGSAFFEVPANTPVAFHPLDANGRALQLMRSWTTVMPGELQSCAGCHEPQNAGPGPLRRMDALSGPPARIKPWYGPPRGFSFNREVQPVLDGHCVRCHDGRDGRPDLTLRPDVPAGSMAASYNNAARFPPAYLALRAHVRGHTIESDMHLLTPCEFHANTTGLVRMLEAGHHGVRLDPESWDRLNTWIDMNTPAHGTWTEIAGESRTAGVAARRRELLNRYAGIDEDPEDADVRASYRHPTTSPAASSADPGLPADVAGTRQRVSITVEPCTPAERIIDLGGGDSLRFARIPAGSLAPDGGDPHSFPRPFWIGTHEIRNRDYARFDPAHDSRIETGDFLQFSVRERGYPCNLPDQPVCRVSRDRAVAFCSWLSSRTGRRVRLPTATEWEWAARAGLETGSPWSADPDAFAATANLADQSLHRVNTYDWGLPAGAVPPYRPATSRVSDNHRVSAPAGAFAANAWGLHDTLGNVWEWVADTAPDGRAVACGGSWYTRPDHAGFGARAHYPVWQPVYDVGFRVIMEE